MPSSYEGKWGKVKYSLRAKLTQSIWLVHKAKTDFPLLTTSEFPFASKAETMIVGLKVWTRCSDFSKTVSHSTPITRAGCFSVSSSIGQEQQHATRVSFYGSDKVTVNVTSEKMGVKQGEHTFPENTQSGESCCKYDRFLLISPQGRHWVSLWRW